MRFLLLTGLLLAQACSTDTFTGDDGGGDASTDGVTPADGPSGGDSFKLDAPPFDPSMLGSSLALWMDAFDAKTGDAGDLVLSWPDHQGKYTTLIELSPITQQSCIVGLHVAKTGSINNRPAVTFCAGLVDIADANTLQLGTTPFFIEAVIFPPQATGTNDVLFTKTKQGDGNPFPSDLTLLAPSPGGNFMGTLNSNGTSSSQNNLEQKFQFVGFVRTSTTIQVRVDGQTGSTATVNSTDDASFAGADVEIGGYRFDTGTYHDFFRGSLAELLVVTDPARLGDVESYFKKKYGL